MLDPGNTPPERAAEHYPGEPPPEALVRELQVAVYGHGYATPYSPAQEWAHLIAMVRDRRLPEPLNPRQQAIKRILDESQRRPRPR